MNSIGNITNIKIHAHSYMMIHPPNYHPNLESQPAIRSLALTKRIVTLIDIDIDIALVLIRYKQFELLLLMECYP